MRNYFIIIILLTSFGVYFNALFNEFVYDDIQQVLENRWIRDIKYIPDIFSKDVWGFEQEEGGWNYYRPLMHIIYMGIYHIFGLRPWGYHLINILFHTGVSTLVFLISSDLFKKIKFAGSTYTFPSFIAALLFATHPIHTEVVTWVAGIPELSFTFFSLSSFFLYIRSDGKSLVKGEYVLSLIFFFLAVLSKETALILLPLLFIYDFIKERRFPTGQIKFYIPYFLICLFYFNLRFHVLGGLAPYKRHGELSTVEYMINVLPLFIKYLEKLLFPVNLNAFYVFHPIGSIFQSKGIIFLMPTIFFIGGSLILLKKNKFAFFSISLIVIPLLPALYIPGLGENTFAERYLYFPSFGFVLLTALIIDRLRCEKRINWFVIPVLLVILGLYSYGTVMRNIIWRNEYILLLDTVKKSPDGAIPHNNLGIVYNERGEIDKAIEHFQAALKLKPNYAGAHNNLGLAYGKKGMVDKAIEHFQIALKLKPQAGTYVNLGIAYSNRGWADEAIKQFQAAIKLKSDYSDAHLNLGIAYGEKGLIDQAIDHLETAVSLNPNDPYAHHNLANAYRLKGLFNKAEEHKQKAQPLEKR